MTSPDSGPASVPGRDQGDVGGDAADRRRRLDEIFGDVLPDTTADERDPDAQDGLSEQWYRDNRPPHHGDRA